MSPTIELFEVVLRFTSALSLTIATALIGVLLVREALRPWQAWLYFGSVVGIIAAWRWLVLALTAPEVLPEGFPAFIAPWVQPINQALYTLAGVAIIVLTLVSSRHRKPL